MPLDLEPEVDRLYGAELGEFVAERTRLARALRSEGRRAEAAQVDELRKPSVPAWTVNQLVRRNRKEIDLLLDAGQRLEEAQKGLLAGGEQRAFTEAREREQDALQPLRGAARAILGHGVSEATLERIAATLRAAIVTADGRSQLSEGRLTTEIEPPGFEAFAGTPLAENAPRTGAPRPKPKPKRAGKADAKLKQEAKTRARANLKAARDREAALAGELAKADRAVAEARKSVDAATRKAERLRVEREAAGKAVETARHELDAASAS